MKVTSLRLSIVLLIALGFGPLALGAGKGEPGPVLTTRVELGDRAADLDLFHRLGLDVDGVFDGWARVYLVREEVDKLERLGYRVTLQPVERPAAGLPGEPTGPDGESAPASYHTYATLTSELQAIAAAHPAITRLTSIGQSVQGRELWMMQLTRDPDLQQDKPEHLYVGAMHGDEVVGKELLIDLINHLVDNDGIDPRVTDLIDDTVIWFLPSMNPDGTELGQRYNANGFDLNRNFPDWYADPNNTPVGRQPETQLLMAWVAAHSINLSANFHGGALVANYPFDNNPSGSSVFSPTPNPDHPTFHSISLTYAQNNPPMYASPSFTDGVTNGAEWYAITGGMQDWGYVWYGKFDITLEVSNIKWPAASTLTGFWDDNLESMLSYMERVHEGLRGVVTDAVTGVPLAAEIRLDSDPFPVYTDPDVGDYHRVVVPGSYSMEVSAPGYVPQTIPVATAAGPAVRYDVALQPLPADLQPIAGRVEDGGNGLLDPGETTDLAVTLKNQGSSATGVSGRLVPTGWYAAVVRAQATYPDAGNQQAVESDAPHHAIHVDAAVPAGHRVGFAVEWEADQAGGMSEPLFLDVGAAGCLTDPATDVPQAITDFGTVTSQISVAADTVIDEIRVAVDISHTYIGDLEVKLIAPTSTETFLHNRSGGGTNDIVGTYGDDLVPAESLSPLSGEPGDGTWTLQIRDLAGGDVGTLNGWSVEICGWPVEATTPEMRFRSLGRDPGGVRMEWWPYPGLDSYRVYRSVDPTSAVAFLDVTVEDGDETDTSFLDTSADPVVFYLVTGVGAQGEGPKGHFSE